METETASSRARILTLGEAIKDLGWFPALYSGLVGGPSILELLQEGVLKGYRLTPAFQWIVDGYSKLTAVMAAVIEPWLLPVIAWVNALFGWHLVLDPIWRPMFLLFLITPSALARASRQKDMRVLRTALAAADAALLPLVIAIAGALLLGILLGGATRSGDFGSAVLILVVIGGILLQGVKSVIYGLRRSDRSHLRLGILLLGGFFTASMIIVADGLFRLLGS